MKTGGYAFPHKRESNQFYSGMTIRDFFAAHALKNIGANPDGFDLTKEDDRKSLAEAMAIIAYEIADAMLMERDIDRRSNNA